MTPREAAGWMHFLGRRKRRDRADLLALMAMAARGEWKGVKKRIQEMSKE